MTLQSTTKVLCFFVYSSTQNRENFFEDKQSLIFCSFAVAVSNDQWPCFTMISLTRYDCPHVRKKYSEAMQSRVSTVTVLNELIIFGKLVESG